jgi:hypothetical protein
MSYRVIHFGWDDCHRVQVLRSAGYEVRELACVAELLRDLQKDEQVDLVVISVLDQRSAEEAAELVRKHCAVPLILFRRYQNRLNEGIFDRVFSSMNDPQVWLNETAALIEHGRFGRPAATSHSEGSEGIENRERNVERSNGIASLRIVPFNSPRRRGPIP